MDDLLRMATGTEDISLDELLEAWEQPSSATERNLLEHEFKKRGYRMSSLPEPPTPRA
jgi:hypothetical protein